MEERLGQSADSIVNGQLTTGEPATVYLEVGCSGTLITPLVVLTACHCQPYSGSWVFFGSDPNGQGTWIEAVHAQSYPGECFGNGDLAVMTLSEPGPTAPIPYNTEDLSSHLGETVRIVGFGQTSEYGGGNGEKRVGYTKLDDVDQGVMWSNPQNGSGTCYGDSGGPNIMTFNGQDYVAGVTSYGTTACGSPWDAAARVDTYQDWVQQYVDAHDPADCGGDGQCAPFCEAPDPDCPCADDGHCTAACAELASDPDCVGCGDDGSCRADCPVLDHDCCGPDGSCFPGCASLDPDCGPGDSGPGDPGGENPGGPGSGSDGDDDDDDGRDDPGGLEGDVGCSLGHGGARAPWALAALAFALLRRRRR